MPDYANAIGQIESGGDYGILGPKTSSGDQAYGKYQVMGNNIGPWSKEVLGFELSPQAFLKSPALQDVIFNSKFQQYLGKYGNSDDAASAWFTGQPLSKGANRSDGSNTGAQYVAKFNQALGSQAPALNAPQQAPQQQQPAPQMPGQPIQQQEQPQAQPPIQDAQINLPQLPQFQSRFNLAQALQKLPLPKGFHGFQLG